MKLNPAELQNLIAFGNRAMMPGSEADTWVELKTKLAVELKRIMDAKIDSDHAEMLKAARPKIVPVPDEPE